MKKFRHVVLSVVALFAFSAAYAVEMGGGVSVGSGMSISGASHAGVDVSKSVTGSKADSKSASSSHSSGVSHGQSRSMPTTVVQSMKTRCIKNVSGNVEETVCQTMTISADEAARYFDQANQSSQIGSAVGISKTSSMADALAMTIKK